MAKSPLVWARDSLTNLVSGLGSYKDKNFHSQYVLALLSQAQVEAAYRGDWVANKIVNIPALDMTREGRSWQADNADIEKIEAEEARLGLWTKLRAALIRARLYGGAALVMGIKQGTSAQEVNLEAIKQGDLEFIHAVSRYELSSGPRITDILSPYYGEPEYYERRNVGAAVPLRIHPSRVVRLLGTEVPNIELTVEGWGDSVLQVVDDAVRSVATVSQGIAALVQEAKLDIIKIPELSEHLSTAGYTDQLQTRFTLSSQMKSLINTLLLDKDEDWERVAADFTALPDVAKLYLLIASGAADIPATRMLGQSPAGLSATGDSDIRNYYDRLKADQKMTLTPALHRGDEVLIRSALGTRDPNLFYEWNSLWQLDEVQKADIATKKAAVAKMDAEMGLVPEQALREGRQNQLVEDGTYPGLEQAIEDAIAEGLDLPPVLDPEKADPNVNPLNDPNSPESVAARQPAVPGAKPGTPANTNVPAAKKKSVGDQLTLDAQLAAQRQRLLDARPRTLYVRRDLLNTEEFSTWAKAQGFNDVLDDPHVTVAFSRTPVDWMKVGQDYYGSQTKEGTLTVAPGGARIVEQLGGAVVLLFNSSDLAWRHRSICDAGASWDYEDYQPHISITYDLGRVILGRVEPYRGELVFGPEVFEELDLDTEEAGQPTRKVQPYDAKPEAMPGDRIRELADAIRNAPPPVVNVSIGPRGRVVKDVVHDADGRVTQIIETEATE